MKSRIVFLIPLIALTLLAGCSGGGTGLSGQPGTSVPTNLFTISGNISGGTTGTYHIDAFTSKTVLNASTWVAGTTVAAPGVYSFKAPVGGTYYVTAYRDANGNGSYDTGESTGWYGGPVAASANAVTTTINANITVVTPPAPSPQMTFSGTVSGGSSGTYYLGAYTNPNDFNTYASGTSTVSGVFSFTVPSGSTYYINAFRDTNSNGLYDTGEASSWYGGSTPAQAIALNTTSNAINFAVITPAPPPAATFTISGSMSGGSSGLYYINAFTSKTVLDSSTWAGGVTLNAAGAFSFQVPSGGTYYLNAYRDTDGDNSYDDGEPTFWLGSGYYSTNATAITITTNVGAVAVISTFTIGGTVIGGTAGNYVVSAFTSTNNLTSTTWQGGTSTAGPSYSFFAPVGGTYYIQTYRDTNSNGSYDSGEPTSFYGGPIGSQAIPVTTTIANADITIPGYFTLTVNLTDTLGMSGNYKVTLWQNGNYTGWISESVGASSTHTLQVLDSGTYYVTAFRDVNGNGNYDTGEPSSAVGVVSFSTPASHVLNMFLF